MRVGSKELFSVVRELAREEVKRVLPGLIREHLTENYLRKMLRESQEGVGSRASVSRLQDVIGDTEEIDEVPVVKKNKNRGIYQHDDAIREARKKLSDAVGLGDIFDDVKPLSEGTGAVSTVPDELIESIDPDKMMRLIGVKKESSIPKRSADEAALIERRIQEHRRSLEVPVAVVR